MPLPGVLRAWLSGTAEVWALLAGFALVGVSPTAEYGYYTERPVRLSDERKTPVLTR